MARGPMQRTLTIYLVNEAISDANEIIRPGTEEHPVSINGRQIGSLCRQNKLRRRVVVSPIDRCRCPEGRHVRDGRADQSSAHGGRGTEFGPCSDWLDEHGIQPQTLVFLTDLCGSFLETAPSYPVLWASTGGRHAPFGEVVPMQAA
jgi:hypothetical protein